MFTGRYFWIKKKEVRPIPHLPKQVRDRLFSLVRRREMEDLRDRCSQIKPGT